MPLHVKKGNSFPYSLLSIGPGADHSVLAVSTQVTTISHPPGGRLPLLSDRPAVTFPAAEHHCPLAGTKLYCLVSEAHRCEQLAQGCYASLPRVGFEPTTCWSQVQCSTCCTTVPPMVHLVRCTVSFHCVHAMLLQLLLSKDGVFIHVTTAQADEDVLLPGQVFIWSKVQCRTVSDLNN